MNEHVSLHLMLVHFSFQSFLLDLWSKFYLRFANFAIPHVLAVCIHRKKVANKTKHKFMEYDLMWVDFYESKNKSMSPFEGRWYAGKKLHQIWAEWAVHASCYLQKDSRFYLYFHKNQLTRGHMQWIYARFCLQLFFPINTYCHHMWDRVGVS